MIRKIQHNASMIDLSYEHYQQHKVAQNDAYCTATGQYDVQLCSKQHK